MQTRISAIESRTSDVWTPEACERLAAHTVDDLRAFARELNVKGRSRMRKQELVEILQRLPDALTLFKRWSRSARASILLSDSSGAPGEAAAGSDDVRRSTQFGAASSHSVPRPPSRSAVASAATRVGGTAFDADRRTVSRLGVVAVDPWSAFVFWKIQAARLAQVRWELGEPQAPLLLRTYDITLVDFDTTNANHCIEQVLENASGRRYVNLPTAGRSICCEIVVKSRQAGEETLAWSNFVQLPSGVQSVDDTPQFAVVNPGGAAHWRPRQKPLTRPWSGAVRPTTAAEAALAADEASSGVVEPIRDGTVSNVPRSEPLPLSAGAHYGSIGLSSGQVAGAKRRADLSSSGANSREVNPGGPSSTALSSWGRRRGKASGGHRESS